MSYVGDQIRAQEQVARRLAGEMTEDASSLRHHLTHTEWQSGAGDAFRAVLDRLLNDLEASRTEVETLADDLQRHASTVEAHEKSVEAALVWTGERARDGVVSVADAAADTVHAGYSAMGKGLVTLSHIGSGH